MGIMDYFNLGGEIAKPIDSIGKLYTTDKDRLAAEEKLLDTLEKPDLAQKSLLDKAMGSSHFFESAWPALTGWTAGACVMLYWLPQLIVANVIWTMNCVEQHEVLKFPILPDDIFNLIYLLFGFGTYTLVRKKFIK